MDCVTLSLSLFLSLYKKKEYTPLIYIRFGFEVGGVRGLREGEEEEDEVVFFITLNRGGGREV